MTNQRQNFVLTSASLLTWFLALVFRVFFASIFLFRSENPNRTPIEVSREIIRKVFRKFSKNQLIQLSKNHASFDQFRDPTRALFSQPNIQTQWWYFSGNLKSSEYRNWEYELVFFIRKTDLDFFGFWPMNKMRDQLFISHFALVDMDGTKDQKNFRYYHRGGILAEAKGVSSTNKFEVQLENWSARQNEAGQIRLTAFCEGDAIELDLTSLKNVIYHGENGFSQRSEDPRIASYHCSLTRLKTTGMVKSKGDKFQVSGFSWLDHEKMLAEPNRFTSGWDWFSIQLDNNEELMIYRFRNKNGSVDNQFSFGTYVEKDGRSRHIKFVDIQLQELSYWQSDLSKGVYPVEWQIKILSEALEIHVRPHFHDCELNCVSTTFVAYWEGPVWVSGKKANESISGRGYQELCGYDRRLSTRLIQFAMTPS